jgi:hypothetical protein
MAILKYSYLLFGIFLFGLINYISYTSVSLSGDLQIKILYSVISFLLLMFDYSLILFTKKLFKKEFKDFTLYMKVSLYIGVFVIPFISLYYS